jgi:hypothetical protein
MFPFLGRPEVAPLATGWIVALVSVACVPDTLPTVAASDTEEEEPGAVAVTVFTDQVQLFMEYPRLVPGLQARFLAHVTVLATGEPVRSGELRLEASLNGGTAKVFEAAQPTRDGLFIPVGAFESPGRYAARILVTSDQARETIPLADLLVHANLDEAHEAARAEAQEDPADTVPFLLEQQWRIPLLLQRPICATRWSRKSAGSTIGSSCGCSSSARRFPV